MQIIMQKRDNAVGMPFLFNQRNGGKKVTAIKIASIIGIKMELAARIPATMITIAAILINIFPFFAAANLTLSIIRETLVTDL